MTYQCGNYILYASIEDVKTESPNLSKKTILKATMEPDYKVIGSRIRQARIAAKYTQSELADAAGVTQSTVAYTEGGNPVTLENLYKFSEILAKPVAYLLGVECGDLSPDEVELVELFRSIPLEKKEAKDVILALIRGYVERLEREG